MFKITFKNQTFWKQAQDQLFSSVTCSCVASGSHLSEPQLKDGTNTLLPFILFLLEYPCAVRCLRHWRPESACFLQRGPGRQSRWKGINTGSCLARSGCLERVDSLPTFSLLAKLNSITSSFPSSFSSLNVPSRGSPSHLIPSE